MAPRRLGALATGAALALSHCAPAPLSPRASLQAAEAALAPRPFTATLVYDEDGRFAPLPPCALPGCRRGAVVSFRVPEGHDLAPFLAARSFVYDDALAVIALSLRGRPVAARRVGDTLAALVGPDGTVGFSFDVASPAFYNVRYVRAGAMAWVGYALALHDARAGERRYALAARAIADRLLATRVTAQADPRAGLIPGGEGAWRDRYRRFDPRYVARWCATEHQIDAWFLLSALGRQPGGEAYRAAADALGERVLARLWLDDEGRFAAAASPEGVVPDRALDAAGAWGALFLLAKGDRARARRALDYTLRTFATVVDGHRGFAPYAGPVGDYPGRDFSRTLFAEGTAGVALALLRSGRRAEAAALARELRALQRRGGGAVPYALPGGEDFPDLPSVAPTAWLLFLEMELAGAQPVVFAGGPGGV